MHLINIQEIESLLTSDKQTLTYLKGKSQNTFKFGVQPSEVVIISENNYVNNHIGDIVDIDSSNVEPLHWLNSVKEKDCWELYGSNHNSGVLWYGKNDDVEHIIINIENEIKKLVHQNTQFNLVGSDIDNIAQCPLVRWKFDDNSSLVILYIDDNCNGIDTSHFFDISAHNIVSYSFGAVLDDILLHEIIQYFPATLLKKIKIPNLEIDDLIEDSQDYSNNILVNNKPKSKKDNELILNLSYHLFCSLMKWHEGINEDEHIGCLAKKLAKYNLLKNLVAPHSNHSERLIFISDFSHKEYNLSLIDNNEKWEIHATYGGIGKKLTSEIKLSTNNLQEAQHLYLSLLDEKLSKGYEIEQSLNNKHKI